VPSGRYRLARTVYVWPGMRVIGYGVTRPVFLLAGTRRVFSAAWALWSCSQARVLRPRLA
jgi:hypothetical protein